MEVKNYSPFHRENLRLRLKRTFLNIFFLPVEITEIILLLNFGNKFLFSPHFVILKVSLEDVKYYFVSIIVSKKIFNYISKLNQVPDWIHKVKLRFLTISENWSPLPTVAILQQEF